MNSLWCFPESSNCEIGLLIGKWIFLRVGSKNFSSWWWAKVPRRLASVGLNAPWVGRSLEPNLDIEEEWVYDWEKTWPWTLMWVCVEIWSVLEEELILLVIDWSAKKFDYCWTKYAMDWPGLKSSLDVEEYWIYDW